MPPTRAPSQEGGWGRGPVTHKVGPPQPLPIFNEDGASYLFSLILGGSGPPAASRGPQDCHSRQRFPWVWVRLTIHEF